MTTTIVRPLELDSLHLKFGGHKNAKDGFCLLEAAAYMAGERWTDSPDCVCHVLAAYGRRLNDVLPDDRRQELRQYLVPMLGTAGDGLAEVRRFMSADWAVRTATPMWLDAADQPERAALLRALPAIVDWETLNAARPVMRHMADELRTLRRAKLAEVRAKAPDAAAVAVAVAAAVAVADADAAADAVAAAVAVADAAADADAVAVAVAVADAAADADAVAAAAADAVAVAAAAADADADYPTWRQTYDVTYAAAKARIQERYAPVTAELQTQAIALFGRMIRPEPVS